MSTERSSTSSSILASGVYFRADIPSLSLQIQEKQQSVNNSKPYIYKMMQKHDDKKGLKIIIPLTNELL